MENLSALIFSILNSSGEQLSSTMLMDRDIQVLGETESVDIINNAFLEMVSEVGAGGVELNKDWKVLQIGYGIYGQTTNVNKDRAIVDQALITQGIDYGQYIYNEYLVLKQL
jgi:hypothetical protein